MSIASASVKNYAIALEALSRINGADAYFGQVASLLQTAIDEAKPWGSTPPPQASTADDDIPF